MATLGMFNSAQINVLSGVFQRRNDIQAVLTNSIGSLNGFHNKVGLWIMDSINPATGDTYDTSGASRTLTNNNLVTFTNDGLIPYANFDGAVNNYLLRLDENALDITGTETFITDNGLSMSGWFYPTNASPALAEHLIGKWIRFGVQRSYRIVRLSNDLIRMQISVDGNVAFSVDSSSTVTINQWNYVAGIYTPSGTSSVILNDTKNSIGGSPASIFNSNSDFTIGAETTGTNLFTGRASMCVLTASRIANQTTFGDLVANTFFQQSRALFGV